MNGKVMNKLSYGLFVLTAQQDGRDNGCIVNTVVQVSSTPNRISVAVNKSNLTHDMILATGQFNVSILSEKAEFATFQNFGFQSGRDADKLAAVRFARSENGLVFLTEQVTGFISGKVEQAIDLGSHTLFIAAVTDGEVLSEVESVTYAYYHKNIKQTAPKAEKKGWICTVCGYIYEGEELPADFICPICKHGAADFKKL